MPKFQLTEAQSDKLQMALAPRPALMAAKGGDPENEAWAEFGRALGFNPETVTNFDEGSGEFDADALVTQPTAGAVEENAPESEKSDEEPQQEAMPATPVSAGEAEGFAKIAGDDLRRTKAASAELTVVAPGLADEKLVVIARESALSEESAQELLSRFAPLAAEAKRLLVTSKTITVTREDQTGEMAMARTMRMELRKIRLRSENLRKGLKDESVKRGRAIDGLNHVVEYLISPEEARLEDLEKFAERAAAERMRLLGQQRYEELMTYGFNPGQLDLGGMEQEAYARLAEGQKLSFEAAEKRKADQKAEEERKAKADEQKRKDDEEKARKDRLEFEEASKRQRARAIELTKYGGDFAECMNMSSDYRDMSEEKFQAHLEIVKTAFEKKAADAKAEQDRKDEELRLSKLNSLRLAELSRFGVKVESRNDGEDEITKVIYADDGWNEFDGDLADLDEKEYPAIVSAAKTRFEAKKIEVAAQRDKDAAEKKKADDKAAAEKKRADDAQAVLDKQKREKDAAERKRKQEEARAARAPDKKKLEAYAAQMAAMAVPTMTTETGKFALEVIVEQFKAAHAFAIQTIQGLE